MELEKIEAFRDRLPDFDWFSVVSDPESDHERKGYVTQHMDPVEHLHNGEADVYLCGPPPMVEAVRVFLNDQENPPQNFYYEKFSSAAGPTGDSSVTAETTATDTSAEVTISAPGVETGQVHRLDDTTRTIFDARMALELGVATLVADILDEDDFVAFRELAEKANSFIEGEKVTDLAGYIAANDAYHEFLFERSGNDAMLQAYRNLEVPKAMDRKLENEGFMHVDIAQEHHDIIDALEAKELSRVRELLQLHNTHAIETMTQVGAAKANA